MLSRSSRVTVPFIILIVTTTPATAAAQRGPDVTLCSVDALQQVARDGDRVAVAAATTAWNVGDRRLDWYEQPDSRHPFIVLNIYRILKDRFEQIGQGWVKHGFYALSNSQCGKGCKDQTDGTQLGVDCTDTYGATLNANPLYLGPRYEINPWTGRWAFEGSHFSASHTHGRMDHQLQFRDAEIDPSANADATYLLEAYYVHFQDVDVTNSAAWRPFTVSGAPGGLWRFALGNQTTGFALDAWQGSSRSTVAIDVPPVENKSPDGRLILASKATQQDGRWRYTYVILNVDNDRQVRSLEIPLSKAEAVETAFHAPAHHGEALNSPGGVPIDNAPWDVSMAKGTVRWSTKSNPIRWGTAYTFSFVSSVGPARGRVSIGLFKAGTPDTLYGEASVPTN